MEITLEAVIGLASLFIGSGGGAFFTWRYMRRKAKAEAQTAEIDAAKEMQGLYKQMLTDANEYLEDARNKVDGLRKERDHYKADRDELREQVSKLTKLYYELKTESEKERSQLRVDITKVKQQMKGLIPLTCSVADCKLRKIIIIEDEQEGRQRKRRYPQHSVPPGLTKEDIEPINEDL